jgi:hypothetical protein
MKELLLMLDVFNSFIVTKEMPEPGSPCHERVVDLLNKHGRNPTAPYDFNKTKVNKGG